MRRSSGAVLLCVVTATLAICAGGLAAGNTEGELPPAVAGSVDFAGDIEPLLRRACHSCHGPEGDEGGLRLDVKQRALEGGDSGKIIVPGDGERSRLVRIVAGLDDELGIMPPEGDGTPLTSVELGTLRAWIDQGASWPDDKDSIPATADHWSFQPIERPALPQVEDEPWMRNSVDAFVLARLEQEGIAPSPEANRTTLVRRLSLDLLGLPPTPEEVEQFLRDSQPDAYERLVERLLASPHYGERWARHWLDLARYADSDGYEKDRPRPHAWRYRSWVIDALNSDQPFDQFSIEQIAGDMLPVATTDQKVATGFHRNTLHNTEGGIDPEEDRVKKTVDRINTVSTIWLGLTVGCAQCHSHKYDPLTQREYYSLYAFLNNMDEADIEVSPDAVAEKAQARTVSERAEERATRVHVRGDFLNPGDPVSPQTPAMLPPLSCRGEQPDRLDLASWMVAPGNPLTARVAVNRIWAHFFGRGLVRTVDDFGKQGELPSHPQLLDWLAAEFRDHWSVKRIQRRIVTSATYRQSAAVRAELDQIDPENFLLARQLRQRVEAEVIRDLGLATAGLLDRRVGGPSVRPAQPSEHAGLTYANSAKWEVSQGGDAYRRGLYTFFQRTSPYPLLMTFDSPDSNICCPRRNVSNTPQQALTLWNDPVFFECAQALGRRVMCEIAAVSDAAATTRARARHVFRICLARDPAAEELDELLELFEDFRELLGQDASAAADIAGEQPEPATVSPEELAGWILVGRTLMNLDEFVTRE